MTIDKHMLALISIVGSVLDVLGALYLAYDLLGGEHGPLRTLTRAVTYGTLFGIGYGFGLGPVFGVMGGLTHGITLASEYSRASRNRPRPGFWLEFAMSGIRGIGFGLGLWYLLGAAFGITFGVVSTIAQAISYQFGIRPTADYKPAVRPRVTRFLMLAVANRTVGYAITAYLCSLIAHQREHALAIGLRTGITLGLVTALMGPITPLIEWKADRIPEKRMGVFGIGLILFGFSLQSLQYWAALLDVRVT